MPLLSYAAITDYPFSPFTKMYSADFNAMFAAIQTLLNTTLLDDVNIQTNGITRNGASSKLKTGTANALVLNGSDGNMSELAMGAALQVPQVNAAGTAMTFGPTPPSAATYVYMSQNFT